MTTTSSTRSPEPLDVLVLESHAGGADHAISLLEGAGHRVHRCHTPGTGAFPCRAVTEPGSCPLDGPIDVALLSRWPHDPRPSRREEGVTCVLRARVPLVEESSGVPDPYAPWVRARVAVGDAGVVAACEAAAHDGDETLDREIRSLTAALLVSAGVEPESVTVEQHHRGASLEVHLTIPIAADAHLQQALSVRVLDALRATARRTYGNVDVYVHPAPREEVGR